MAAKNTAEGIAFILQLDGIKCEGTRAFEIRNGTIGLLGLDRILVGETFENHCNGRERYIYRMAD